MELDDLDPVFKVTVGLGMLMPGGVSYGSVPLEPS